MAKDTQTWVVTGANRGLGLEFARRLAAAGHEVIGTARDADGAADLSGLGARVEELDVADGASVAAFARRLGDRPVDVLVNNAGRQYREGRLDAIDFAELEDTFAVNAYGPIRVTRALLPNLRAGRARRVVHVTSRMGSFGELEGGGMMAYRASKAALNMLHRCVAADLGAEGFLCVALHPGWVRTDMGGPDAAVGIEESVAGMLDVLAGLSAADHGAFLDYTGAPIAW
jgi:NAD(P)-dependent dehydrogenase (short-subunit alcohol dehydrogenase family)